MRWLGCWAVVIACSAVLSVPGCLTSQDNPSDGEGPEDPPITIDRGGTAGTSQGGNAGENTGGRERGGSAGTSGTGNGEGGSDGGCVDDQDCEARPDARSRCSAPTGECVDCLTVADCDSGEECVDNECRPFTSCTTTDQCPQGQVCNRSTYRCVQCVSANDCAAGDLCVNNTCRKGCSTDSHCTPYGLVCGDNYCASCASDRDCPATRNCQQGNCVRDICTEGASSCQGNTITGCNENGSAFTTGTTCTGSTSCTENSSGARCAPWICTPGAMATCSLTTERVVNCSADGLRETVVEDCAANMQLCFGSSCSDAACEPNTLFCQANTIQLCDSTGMMSTTQVTCPTGQLCNPATTACATPLCAPNMPTCDMEVARTCDATGFGYTGAGTDCTATMEFCSLGMCGSSRVDTIGTTTLSGTLGNYAMLDIFSVSNSRTLTQIEQYMSTTAATTLTWHVFESTTATGTYTSISNTTSTSTTGAAYMSSGALSVPLVAGRYYAIGASWTASLTYGLISGTPSATVSFGSMINAIAITPPPATTTITVSSTPSYYFPQRLTTAAP